MYIFHIDALAAPNEELIQRLPRRNGILLWRGLYESSLGRMGVVVTEAVKTEVLETWMRLHNVRAAVYEVLDPEEGALDQQIENMMIKNGMRTGDLYVDVDPDRTANVLHRGISTVLLGDPYVVRKEWVKDEPPSRDWSSLVEEMDRQAVLRSKKEWREE